MRMLVSVFGSPQQLDVPEHIHQSILDLQREYDEGDITQKGFEKKLAKLVDAYMPKNSSSEKIDEQSPNSTFTSPQTLQGSSDEYLARHTENLNLKSEYSLPTNGNNFREQQMDISQTSTRSRANSNAPSIMSTGNNSIYGGFKQTTSKLDIILKEQYPKPNYNYSTPNPNSNSDASNISHRMNKSVSSNNSTFINQSIEDNRFRTMPRHLNSNRPSRIEPIQTARSSSYSTAPEPAFRSQGNGRNSPYYNDMERSVSFGVQQIASSPLGVQFENAPLTPRVRTEHHFRSESSKSSNGHSILPSPRLIDRYEPDLISRGLSNNSRTDSAYTLNSRSQDFDRSSTYSQLSFDPRTIGRRSSIDSHRNSIYSKEAPSVHHYTDLKPMPSYPNIVGVLNHRILHTPKAMAYTVVDAKNKDHCQITWERLHNLIDKYLQLLLERRGTKFIAGSRICLFFRKVEVVEFLAATYACFVAATVAVPIVATETLDDLQFIIDSAQARIVLTSDTNYKGIHKSLSAGNDQWFKNIEWIRAAEGLSRQFKRKKVQPFKDPSDIGDLAMLEYSKDTNGSLRAVGISHRTLLAQSTAFREYLEDRELNFNLGGEGSEAYTGGNRNLPSPSNTGAIQNLVIAIEPRAHFGLLLGGFISPFCGFHTIYISSAIFDMPMGLLNSLSKFKANFAITDYSGLSKTVSFTKQSNRVSYSERLGSLQILFIDTLLPDPDLDSDVVKYLLQPHGARQPWGALAPVCSLPNHGGMVVSIGEPANRPAVDTDNGTDPRLLWLDREALVSDRIDQVKSLNEMSNIDAIKVVSFGSLMPDVTVIIVDPQTGTILSPDRVGEIWVDSPALSGGYWNLPELTDEQFRAKAYFPGTEQELDGEFLRTGLAGSLVDRQLVVFGLLDQYVKSISTVMNRDGELENRVVINHGSDVTNTLVKSSNDVSDGCVFEITVRDLPASVVAIETPLTEPKQLDQLVVNIKKACLEVHRFTPYAIMMLRPKTLPRKLHNGSEVVSYFKARQLMLQGDLKVRHVTIDAENLKGDETDCEHQSLDDERQLVPQHTGMEMIPPAVDERFGTELEGFKSITQLLQLRATACGADLAYNLFDGKKSAKIITFDKLNTKAINLAYHLIGKKKLAKGSAVLVFMPSGIDYNVAVHGLLAADMVVLPYWDFDVNRLNEELPALVHLIEDFDVKCILVNPLTEERIKSKPVLNLYKRLTKVDLPPLINIDKVPKPGRRLEGQFTGLKSTLVMIHYDPDMKRQCIAYGPTSVLKQCKLHKYELNLVHSKPLLNCARLYNGIGFFHNLFLGIYVGSTSILLPQNHFSTNPSMWFELLATNQCVATYATGPMIQHAANSISSSQFQKLALSQLHAVVVPMPGRLEDKVMDTFKALILNSQFSLNALVPAYSTPFHPLISHRTFADSKPLELHLHFPSLRLGRVRLVEDGDFSLKVRDLGRVARDTMIAIVNPYTKTVCQLDEVGEIWVVSDCNADGLYFPTDAATSQRFGAQIEGGDPSLFYIRTGDLGFLYPDIRTDRRPIAEIVATDPRLFVLGPMHLTVDVDGKSHFVQDIENTVRACHKAVLECLVYGHDNRVSVVVEVDTTLIPTGGCNQLTPLLITTLLELHNFVPHQVIYLKPDTILRSRIGEVSRLLTRAALSNKKLIPLEVYNSI